ncbi:MAG: hypothetical protein GX051_05800 [Clostridiales bacterium]|nr:hypothetical protein [Clostridiales bacterium]
MEKYIIVALAVLVVAGALLLLRKASESGRKAREIKEKELKYLEREKHLRETFAELDIKKVNETEDSELLSGACMNIQMRLEKSSDMTAEFNTLPEREKYIYTLGYFAEDTAEELSGFYRKNGEPLTSLASTALEAVGEAQAADCAGRMYPMFDGEDEEVSFDEKKVEAVNGEFRSVFDRERFLKNCAAYIRRTF